VFIAVDQNANGNMIFRRNSGTEAMRIAGSNGAVSIASTTAATNTTTGALVVSGGVGIAGAAYIGGLLDVVGNATFQGTNVQVNGRVIGQSTLTLTSNGANAVNIQVNGVNSITTSSAGAITLGSASSITAASATNLTLAGGSSGASLVLGQGTGGIGTFNAPTGQDALFKVATTGDNVKSANLQLTNAAGTSWYVAIGGSTSGTSQIRNNLYFFNSTEKGVMTTTGNFLWGGNNDISGSGGLKVFGTTASTSTTTGAFQVSGGVGIAGAVYAGGAMNVSGIFTQDNQSTSSNIRALANGAAYGNNEASLRANSSGNSLYGATSNAAVLRLVAGPSGRQMILLGDGNGGLPLTIAYALNDSSTPTTLATFSYAGGFNLTGVATLASATATPAGGSTSARLLFGTTAGFGIYYGSGAPSVSAAQGSIYLRSDGAGTTSRLYVNTDGATTWTNFTSAT
jgi:hypothetical protein